MKPKTNRIEWSEELCKRRHDKLIELRKEKAGNNPFKKWFYLGKKINLTRYKIIKSYDEIHFHLELDNIKHLEEANEIARELEKIKTENVYYQVEPYKIKSYEVESYYDAPYDKLRYKAFKRWQKKVEKYGIEIKRPYFYEDEPVRYQLWKSNNWDNCYRKFTSYWWKEVFDNIKRKFQYGYKICTWDYYDIFNYLFVSLTVKGLFLGLYGKAVTHKEQMHEIWECRKELIKAYNYEDYYDWVHDVDTLKDNPDSNYYTERTAKEELCIKNAFDLLGKSIRNWWD